MEKFRMIDKETDTKSKNSKNPDEKNVTMKCNMTKCFATKKRNYDFEPHDKLKKNTTHT